MAALTEGGGHGAGKRSKLWTTFNEPGVAAMCGHIVGNHPPGKLLHFKVQYPCTLLVS
jgi:beta-glucosidase/6-phospho-beta-glucosidase/beta-galactosidase